ncbi:MAG: hypothetical protein IBX69_05190 [Anaerolineales bacterium]|nr:hypothetical protein [Anaerolineales bacterium]
MITAKPDTDQADKERPRGKRISGLWWVGRPGRSPIGLWGRRKVKNTKGAKVFVIYGMWRKLFHFVGDDMGGGK